MGGTSGCLASCCGRGLAAQTCSVWGGTSFLWPPTVLAGPPGAAEAVMPSHTGQLSSLLLPPRTAAAASCEHRGRRSRNKASNGRHSQRSTSEPGCGRGLQGTLQSLCVLGSLAGAGHTLAACLRVCTRVHMRPQVGHGGSGPSLLLRRLQSPPPSLPFSGFLSKPSCTLLQGSPLEHIDRQVSG